MRFNTTKYALEYSKKQNVFHVQTLKERLSRPRNGFMLLGIYNNADEAYDMAIKMGDFKSEIKI